KNDQTLRQTGLAKMMFNADDARWYSGYSNSLTFNAPWIRVDVCPNTPGACGLSSEESIGPNVLLSPNPGTHGFEVSASGVLQVTDLFGRVVHSAPVAAGQWVDAAAWAQGYYLVSLDCQVQRWIKH
ncbi:MAG: T9SS type A sorting domain-containing protein, partial [Schleiferiaceae bacterium]